MQVEAKIVTDCTQNYFFLSLCLLLMLNLVLDFIRTIAHYHKGILSQITDSAFDIPRKLNFQEFLLPLHVTLSLGLNAVSGI